MNTEADEAIDDDINSKELLHELYENGQDTELTRLTEMVRKHYLNFLEKQLQENLLNANFNNNKNNGIHKQDYDEETCKKSIKKTAELLEDKAVKACMIAKFYQKAMIKIIAIVRRTTQEKRLINHLEKCIKSKDESNKQLLNLSKETQTEAGLLERTSHCNEQFESQIQLHEKEDSDQQIISLDEKIEMFQKHLQKEKSNDIAKKYHLNNKQYKMSKRQNKHHYQNHRNEHNSYRGHHMHQHVHYCKPQQEEIYFSPASSSVITAPTTPISPVTKPPHLEYNNVECSITNLVVENENSNDSVAVELARLFSEEKTELDEIFGIDPNEEPDDPQICKILKEIEDAKISHTKTDTEIVSHVENPPNEIFNSFPEPKTLQPTTSIDLPKSIDLSKSIWPCELFMQRRKLSECLARLIEEDLRWHDIMKWKFSQLFGEDSDDEFTPCSPSIELDEVLVGSCIRRISPWVVKHLMKPMRDGLIGNRFLFKKLAKSLARSIVMENQYSDEFVIKECVENFFCLHQAVMSLEDLDVDMPSISSF